MRIVIVKSTRNKLYRHIIFLHRTESHDTDTSLKRQELKSIMASTFRIYSDASAIFQSSPDCLIKMRKFELKKIFKGEAFTFKAEVFFLNIKFNV